MLAGIFKNWADTIVPPRCLLCNNPILEDGCLCPSCFNTVEFFTPPWDDKQGMPCSLASYQEKPLLAKGGLVRCALHYKNGSRKLIHVLKYRDRGDIAPALAHILYKIGRPLLDAADCLIPVPVSYIRHIKRRYNQSAECARALQQYKNLPVYDVLRRKNQLWKGKQITFNRAQRFKNVESSFFLPDHLKNLIKGATVLLIDDVITTGATIATCGKILRRAGAKRVHALAIARTVLGSGLGSGQKFSQQSTKATFYDILNRLWDHTESRRI